MSLVRLALKKPVAILVTLTGLTLSGILAYFYLPVELLPNVSFGVITITTPVRGGMSPLEIERQVTRPIESAVSSVAHLRNMISNSKKDKSIVSLEFEPGTDMNFATLDVREKFARIRGQLPDEIESPIIANYRESDVPIFIFALMSEKKTPEALRAIVDQKLKEKLLRVNGMAHVEIAGGRERKVIIDVDRYRLASYGMDIRRLVEEIGKANLNLKAGAIESDSLESTIRAVGQFESLDQISQTIVGFSKQGSAIQVKDVATVRDSFLERESLSRLNSKSAVTVYLQKESGANTIQVVQGVNAVLAAFQKDKDQDIEYLEVSNQAGVIKEAIQSVRSALLVGVVLVVIVLGFFLGLRPALIVAVSIPLVTCMMGALLYLSNWSINVMTLSGLALAIGLLVDNSIVVLESIFKKGQDFSDKSLAESTGTVTSALVGGTLTTIVVFIPFVLFSKQIQLLYSGMAVTVTGALLLSLFVALASGPLLVRKYISRRPDQAGPAGRYGFVRMTTRLYEKTLPLVFQYKKKFIAVVLGLCGVAIYLFQFHLEKNLSSGQEQNEFVIYVELPSGKKLDISNKIVAEVEEKVRAHPETKQAIKSVTTRIEGWSSKVYVALHPKKERDLAIQEVIDSLRPVVSNLGEKEDAFIYFSSPISDQELIVNVYGHKEKETVDYALQVAGLMQGGSNFEDVKIRYRPGRPEVLVQLNPQRTALFGLSPSDVGRILHAQTRGLRATYFRDQNQEVETVVRLRVGQRESIDSVKSLLIPTPKGGQVRLEQMADFEFDLAPSEIWRRNKERMVQVSANLKDTSLEAAAKDVKKMLAQIPFTTDYWAEIGGDFEDRVQAQKDFGAAFILMGLLIFGILACLFESLTQPLFLFVSVPLSLIGIVGFLFGTQTPVTLGVLIGILMTGGIAVNHAILYMNAFNGNRTNNKDELQKSLSQAGQERLRPILMTTLTTCLGLIPMALDQSSNAHLWSPMAIATIGGLLSSMILTLYFLPTLILLMNSPRPRWIPSVSLIFLSLTLVSSSIKAAPSKPLPTWVDKVISRRVNDLITEGKVLEREEKYNEALELYMDAVRMAPAHKDARKALLRANRKSLRARKKKIKKLRKAYVQEAQDQLSAKKAFHRALEGRMKEAERHANRNNLPKAFDLYHRILEEAPTYTPAQQRLDETQERLKKQLEKGGGFSSEEEKAVAQGFAYYNDQFWKEAYNTWNQVTTNPDWGKRWGKIRLGEYSAKALKNHQAQVRQEKIDKNIQTGLNHFRSGQLKEAMTSFEVVLEMEPSHTQAKEYTQMIPGLMEQARADVLVEVEQQQLARTLSDGLEFYLKGFYDEAESKVKLILDRDPAHAQALNLQQDILKARGLTFEERAKTHRGNQSVLIEERYSDGIIAFAEGRYEDAKKAWEDVLDQDPNHPQAQQALKKIAQEMKNP